MVDNALAGQTQASWVGMGWALEIGYIERNQNSTPSSSDDTYSFSAGGVDSMLLPAATAIITQWMTKLLRVRRIRFDDRLLDSLGQVRNERT